MQVPTLVVQGARDPFGMPPEGRLRAVVQVAGDHGLRSDLESVAAAVGSWLHEVLRGQSGSSRAENPGSRPSRTARVTASDP